MCAVIGTIAGLVSSVLPSAAGALGISSGTLLSGIGAATGAASSIVSGVAQNRSAQFNAKVQENNAQHLRNIAVQEEDKARLDIVRRQREIGQFVGGRSALIGASGIEQASGSALQTLVSDIEQGALDVAILRANADQSIQDLIFQSDDLKRQAALTRREGRFALGGSVLSAAGEVGSFLGGLDLGSTPTASKAASQAQPTFGGQLANSALSGARQIGSSLFGTLGKTANSTASLLGRFG